MNLTGLRCLGLLASLALLAWPAYADLDLRVQSRPRTSPIQAFARVTDGDALVPGLTADDFAATLDGLLLDGFTLRLPPAQDPAQHLSVVLVVNNGSVASAAESAVWDFITQMRIGDYASVITTRYSIDSDLNVPLVQPFTQIDGGTGTSVLVESVRIVHREGYPQMLRSLVLALDQFAASPVALPEGPRAIIVLGTGRVEITWYALEDVVSYASELGIPIFAIEAGDNAFNPDATARMTALAADTGGVHFAAHDAANVAAAYQTVSELLTASFQLSISRDAVTDCNPHMLEVIAHGQAGNSTFNRCDTTPDPFIFEWVDPAVPGSVVVSDGVTITGIDGPTVISVADGEYSIGCASTFTSAAGYVLPDEQVCVRHTAALERGFQVGTTLMAGGVSALFVSTAGQEIQPPPPDDNLNGGGGATGALELLLALGLSFAVRSRR